MGQIQIVVSRENVSIDGVEYPTVSAFEAALIHAEISNIVTLELTSPTEIEKYTKVAEILISRGITIESEPNTNDDTWGIYPPTSNS